MLSKQDHVTVKDCSHLNNYISYFQSVTTIGIISKAQNALEAESKAKEKFRNSDLSCGIVAQTPYEVESTEKWATDLSCCVFVDNSSPNMVVGLDNEIKPIIAKKLNKEVPEVTEEDYEHFFSMALSSVLQ